MSSYFLSVSSKHTHFWHIIIITCSCFFFFHFSQRLCGLNIRHEATPPSMVECKSEGNIAAVCFSNYIRLEMKGICSFWCLFVDPQNEKPIFCFGRARPFIFKVDVT
jgi:hypothetical protein